jgi:nucleoside-diphosphate-sugar epimerase
MEKQNKTTSLKILVTDAAGELGRKTVAVLLKRGHRVVGQVATPKELAILQGLGAEGVIASATSAPQLTQALQSAQPEVVLNLTPQKANTLLHDGHAWRDYDNFLSKTTAALVKAAQSVSLKLLVHTSYAFLYGNRLEATENDPLQIPGNNLIFAAAIQAEKLVADSKLPLCLLRLGFLYGPQSHDLVLYERSFRIFRPYYAGPDKRLANFLHFEDAALALALVAEQQPVGEIFNVTDEMPAYFGDFMDYFAQQLGYLRPAHLPTLAASALPLLIAPAQIDLLNLSTTVSSTKIRQRLGWQPAYSDYFKGLTQVLQTWKAHRLRR